MYVIKWISVRKSDTDNNTVDFNNNEDYLECIKDKLFCWDKLKRAMLFKSPEEAIDYVLGNLNNAGIFNQKWLKTFANIIYIHPLNIR